MRAKKTQILFGLAPTLTYSHYAPVICNHVTTAGWVGDSGANEGLPGGLGNRGNFFPGEQRPKNNATGEHMQFWGTGNIESQDFIFGE